MKLLELTLSLSFLRKSLLLLTLTALLSPLGFAGGNVYKHSDLNQLAPLPSPLDPVSNPRSRPIIAGPVDLTIFTPSAFSMGWSDVAGEFGYVNHWVGTTAQDGYMALNIGLGDPRKLVGGTISILIDSIDFRTNANNKFADNGTVSFKLSHMFNGTTAIAAGIGNFSHLGWGVFTNYADSYYIVGTKVFNLRPNANTPLPLSITAGWGTGAFHSTSAFRSDLNSSQFIGAIALRFLPKAAVIADYDAKRLSLGLSVIPPIIPLILGFSVENVVGDGSSLPKVYLFTIKVGAHLGGN